MPEGPELHLASVFVNACCKGRVFSGKIVKNPVHKSSDVEFEAPTYTIAAVSRGKEMQLILTKQLDSSNTGGDGGMNKKVNHKNKGSTRNVKDAKKLTLPETLKILFRFGMSGNFQFTIPEDIHKHSHLRFFTKDEPPMVLSYVDIRRFGRWDVGADWSKGRGPDPMFEYRSFRSNVVQNIQKSAFDQPICETLLNQKFFNGIGNYLRAEILFRLSIQPFEKARTVLEGLSEEPPDVKPMKGGKGRKGEEPDILHLCHTVPLEVIAIGAGGYTADGKASDYSDFMKWLQCYYQDGMTNMVDHKKRTIWFTGPPGPMLPKDEKSRRIRSPKKRKQATDTEDPVTPVKSKKLDASESDISEKKGKKTSKHTTKMASETMATTKAAASSAKRKTASKKKKEDIKKGRGDAKKATSSSTEQHKNGKHSATSDLVTPVKSKKLDASESDISEKKGKKTSKHTTKMASETMATTKAAASSAKRKTASKKKNEDAKKGKEDAKKGKGDAKKVTSSSTEQHNNGKASATIWNGSKKERKSTKIAQDSKHNNSMADLNGNTDRGKARSRTTRGASKK